MAHTRFLQTAFWADFKSHHGWKSLLFKVTPSKDGERPFVLEPFDGKTNEQSEVSDTGSFILSVMTRTFSLKLKKFTLAYIPMATEADESFNGENEIFSYLKKNSVISELLKEKLPKNTVYIRFDFPLDFDSISARDDFTKKALSLCKKNHLHFVHSKIAVQPPDTTILDLTKTEDELLSGMKNKWRYNIRLAAKKGVSVECYDGLSKDFEKAFEIFYGLFEITSKRDGVSFHGKEYYKSLLLKSAGEKNAPKVRLYLARHEDDWLAGIITLFCPREAVYLYGASGNIKRNLMAAYLLQWTAIQDAKKEGCPCYDFYGMPPDENPSHPMHGLYLFKTGFGGAIIHRSGSWDYILRPALYRFYTAAEKMRAWFYRVLRKKIAGR